MANQRNHNEWFRTVSLGGRKSCPTCREKLEPGESIWTWGEYVCAKWRNVKHFCKLCFSEQVQKPLLAHAGDCGCSITLQIKDWERPAWLTLETPSCPVTIDLPLERKAS